MCVRGALLFLLICSGAVCPASAGNFADASRLALTGRVTSAQEGAMEGVLVSAKRDGSPLTITVVTDATGRYGFPADRLAPGHYTLTIRAIGYELARPAAADVEAEQAASADLALALVADISAQLTSTEWFISMPGTAEQKRPLIECMSCHTLERVLRSKFNADEFVGVLKRMANFANNSTTTHPQTRMVERPIPDDRARKVAEYLASVNLSGGREPGISRSRRCRGRRARDTRGHHRIRHAARDDRAARRAHRRATASSGTRTSSRISSAGSIRDRRAQGIPLSQLKPGFPDGALALEPDPDGNWWLALMFQAGLARFDVKTEKFQLFPVQSELNNETTQQSLMMPWSFHVDGKVWTNDVGRMGIMRLDLASGKYEFIDPFKFQPKGRQHSPYGMAADASNNLYFMDFADENVGRIDAKTKAPTIYPTPTPRSRPRRTMLDDQGQLWFAEFAANKLGMFDLKNEKMKEWDVPTPHTYPYDVFMDKTGALWSGNMSSDRILRFDPRERHLGRISPAAPDQHPPHLRRQHHHAGDVLGRQQPPRRDHQAGAAGLIRGRGPALEPFLVHIPEAARYLGNVHRATVCRLIAAGKIEARRLGSRTLVVVPSLKAYAESLARNAGQRPVGRRPVAA